MSLSHYAQRRTRMSRASLPSLLTLTASVAAGLFGMTVDSPQLAFLLTGLAGAVGASAGARALATRPRRSDDGEAGSPVAQWKPYSESLIESVPEQLPPANSTFQGRAGELEVLHERHRRWRNRARDGQAGAPVVIFLHGMAGIGKSAVAQSLAHELTGQYPDGQLYANLGVAGTARPPAQVLHSFLSALSWDAQFIPESTAERALLFRALTRGKRMLIVLDAARDQAQLRYLMPSETGCAVIVTSRRDMSPAFGARSLQIGPLTLDDGLDLLDTLVRHIVPFDVGAATAIVDACGGHPLALRAAADIAVQQRMPLAGLAARLREPGGLTAVLRAPSRDLHDRLTGEYQQLSHAHQKAFRVLASVRSRTFVPWVLGPAADVSVPEAENLLADLASAQLVLAAGRDEVTGIDRYELPPVARQLAESLAGPDDFGEHTARQLDEAYLEVAEKVIQRLDPEFAANRALPRDRYLPPAAMFAVRVARQGQAKAWVREEYGNLLRAMGLADQKGDHALSTRIASWLGGCVPRGVAATAVLDGFTAAVDSARMVGDGALADVLLARGAYRTALERYGPAFDDFAGALALCHAGNFRARRVLVERRCGEAHLRAGEYTAAASRFARAEEFAGQIPDGDAMLPLIRTLRCLADPEATAPGPAGDPPLDDEQAYWFALARCDRSVEGENWDEADRILLGAAADYHGDLRRAATIGYWQARLHLARHHRKTGDLADVRRAVRAAHRSLHDHQLLDDPAGQVRVRCNLVSAYLVAGRPDEAVVQLEAALAARGAVDPWLTRPGNPLDALLRRARADVRRHQGHGDEAVHDMRQAAFVLAANGDRRAVAEIAMLTGDDVAALWHDAEPEVVSDAAVHAYLDDGLPVVVGRPARLRVEISAAHLRRYRGAVTGDRITVLVCAGNADVDPMGADVDLTDIDEDVLLVHELRPRRQGSLVVKVQLYAPADGVLLQEFEASLPPVARPEREAA
jgi:tetratricopeptide (TPR) repeat protein